MTRLAPRFFVAALALLPLAAACPASPAFAADPPAYYAPLPLTMDTSQLGAAPLTDAEKQAVMEWSKTAEKTVRLWYPRIVEALGAYDAPVPKISRF